MDYLKIYNSLDSTNKEAHRLLAQGFVENGLTLVARHQIDGRGQFGRAWVSEPDNHLAMTIIHQPAKMNTSELPSLGMKVSLGIAEAIKQIDPDLRPLIKWPNDIYVNGKKLSGILIENSLSGAYVQNSIIGIGMNINETTFPAELPNAVSLFMLTHQVHDIISIAEIIREHVLRMLQSPPADWKTIYDDSIYGKEKTHSFESANDKFNAIVQGVSMDGALILHVENGEVRSYLSHEVKWIL